MESYTFTSWHDLASLAHDAAVRAGFYEQKHTDDTLLMLIVTEIAEAVNADRRGRHADTAAYETATVIEQSAAVAFDKHIKDTVEDELADIALRLLDFAGAKQYDIPADFPAEKLFRFYNAKDHIAEDALRLTAHVLRIAQTADRGLRLALRFLLEWTDALAVPIEWHIREKMAYNATRPALHGKQY